MQSKCFQFGVFEADPRTGELRKNGSKLKLQDQPFQVLLLLLSANGGLVTREEIRLKLWSQDTFVDFDHSLNTAINKLREVLNDSASSPRYIETLARRGYRFITPVKEITPAVAPVTAQSVPIPATQSRESVPATTPTSGSLLTAADEVPATPRSIPRTLFLLIQVMYLIFYIAALANLPELEVLISAVVRPHLWMVAAIVVSAGIGIPIRLYLLSSVSFDYRGLPAKFQKLFVPLFLLDEIWAFAPFLVMHHIGFGLSLAATVALLYLPFSQRTLVFMGYPKTMKPPAAE